jgi:hypothetical protein
MTSSIQRMFEKIELNSNYPLYASTTITMHDSKVAENIKITGWRLIKEMTLIERLEKLALRLEDEGQYTNCNIVIEALDRIKILEQQLSENKNNKD